MDSNPNDSILALDIGEKRVGVAIAHAQAGFPRPLVTLPHDAEIFEAISRLCQQESVGQLVAGLPRGMAGQETAQTAYARAFMAELASTIDIPLYLIDEAVTSAKAEAELQGRGKPYSKADIDALAATIILEDYLHSPASAERVTLS